MELFIFLLWICIAHIMHFINAIRITNQSTTFSEKYFETTQQQLLIESYVSALFWPYSLLLFIMDYSVQSMFGWLRLLKDLENYIEDIYWDIDCFYAFIQESVIIEEKK